MRLSEAIEQDKNDFQSAPKSMRLSEAMSQEKADLENHFSKEMPFLFPGVANEQGDTVYDVNQTLNTLQKEQGKIFPEMQAFEQGVLPLGKTKEERTALAQEHPIATAVGNIAGLIGVGAATAGVGPAVTLAKPLAAVPLLARIAGGKIAQSTMLNVAAGRMAATGLQFGVKELADQAAEIVSGDKKSFNEVFNAVCTQTAFGAGFGAVGAIPAPLLRIPAEGAYGFFTAKVQGATNLEAGVSGALFAILGAFNLKNYNESYARQAAAGARRGFVDKMTSMGVKPEAAEMAANRYFNHLEKVLIETKGGKFRTLNASDYEAMSAKMREPWKREVEPILPKEALPQNQAKTPQISTQESTLPQAQTTPEAIATPKPALTTEQANDIITKGGGEVLSKGTISDGLAYFNDPTSKSTMVLPVENLTPEAVKAKIEEKQAEFKAVEQSGQPPTAMTFISPEIESAYKRIENIKKDVLEKGIKSPGELLTYKSAVKKLVNDIGKTNDNKAKLLLAKILPASDKLMLINNVDQATNAKGINSILSSLQSKLSIAGLRAKVRSTIAEKRLKNIENLRKMRRLPTIDNMHPDQLKMFDFEISQLEEGDVLLTQRQLETVDNTDLKGIKTLREARAKLAEQAGVSVESLQNIKVSELDRMRYDTDLASRNPLYRVMVEETRKNILESEKRYLDIETKINELTIKARESRKQSLLDKLIPTDKVVFNWLSADEVGKSDIAKTMTKEEMKLAEYLQDEFAEALKYLISTRALETGRENYITNVRRGFVEALKEDGFGAAMQEVLDQQKLDAQTFNILDQATDEILPLNKFFRFALQRTGGLKPSQNVAKAASIYFRTFEKKKALDAIIPKLTIYAQALTPERFTAKGLEFDQSIKKFVNEWINTKKGRPTKVFIQPGGKIDVAIKSLKAFLTIKDLALNIPVGISSGVGESVASYVNMGKEKIALALSRRFTDKGKRIIKKYENFVGKGVFEELAEPSKDISDKVGQSLFSLFKVNSIELNKIHLLGSMTNAEFEAEEVSPLALAQMQLDMGRFRAIEASKSILGSTTEGGLWTHYKSWAIPILTTTAKDLSSVIKDFTKGNFKEGIKTREFAELVRILEITSAALIVGSFMAKDKNDKSFGGKLIAKAYRESLTIMGALDAKMLLSVPRLMAWGANLGDAINLTLKLEKYKSRENRGKLKGVEKLKRELMPTMIKQFLPDRGK